MMDKLTSNWLKMMGALMLLPSFGLLGDYLNVNRWIGVTIMFLLVIFSLFRMAILLSDWSKEQSKKEDANVSDGEVKE